ncbi:MAG: TolC family protein [Aureliella sp.]
MPVVLRNCMTLLLVAVSTTLPGQEPLRSSEAGTVAIAAPLDGPLKAQPVSKHEAPSIQAMELADFESLAFQSNPTLAAATARMNVARGKKLQAGLYPNPVVGYHGVEMGLRGTSGQQGGFISQQFITGQKRQLDRAIAGKEIDEAHFRFYAQEQRVLSDVRIRFYDTLVAQRRVALTRELARLGDELVTATGRLIDARQGTENDLLQAEIRADESQILLSNSLNQNAEAWRRLVTIVGMPSMEFRPVAGKLDANLPNFDWDSCYAKVLDGNPVLQAARTRADRAKIMVQRARKEPIPNVDLSVSHRHHNVTTDDVTNVQVGIPIPVFNRNQGNIQSAQAQWLAACNEARRVELDLQDRLAVAYRRYANARQQVDRYSQRMVPRAERSLKLVTDGYRMGQVEYLTLLNAQQTYLQVNLSYLNSLRELRTASSEIDGQLLTGSLVSR